MLHMAKALLESPGVYIAVQRALRADRARYECLREVDLKPGHRVLDVGCGPAYYVDQLPAGVDYHGFDTDAAYIGWARNRFGGRGQFHVDTYTEEHRQRLPKFDRVLLLGLLHHLDDDEVANLLALVGRSLAPGGVVVSLDPCFDPALHALQSFMAANDRGRFVRTSRAFEKLGTAAFADVAGRLVEDRYVPVRQWIMRLENPR